MTIKRIVGPEATTGAAQIAGIGSGCPRHNYRPGQEALRRGEFSHPVTRGDRLDSSTFVLVAFWEKMLKDLDNFKVGDICPDTDLMNRIANEVFAFAAARMVSSYQIFKMDPSRREIADYYRKAAHTHLEEPGLIDHVGKLISNLREAMEILAYMSEGLLARFKLEVFEREVLPRYAAPDDDFRWDTVDYAAMGIDLSELIEEELTEMLVSRDFVNIFFEIGGIESRALLEFEKAVSGKDRVLSSIEGRMKVRPEFLEFVPKGDRRIVRFCPNVIADAEAKYRAWKDQQENPQEIRTCSARAALLEIEEGGRTKKVAVMREFIKWVLGVFAREWVPRELG